LDPYGGGLPTSYPLNFVRLWKKEREREREREQEGHPHGIELEDLDVFREASSGKSFMRF
jgi:hypothetical protein